MRDFDPIKSFGEDAAASYDDTLRGDEAETADWLGGLADSARPRTRGRHGAHRPTAGCERVRVDGIEAGLLIETVGSLWA